MSDAEPVCAPAMMGTAARKSRPHVACTPFHSAGSVEKVGDPPAPAYGTELVQAAHCAISKAEHADARC